MRAIIDIPENPSSFSIINNYENIDPPGQTARINQKRYFLYQKVEMFLNASMTQKNPSFKALDIAEKAPLPAPREADYSALIQAVAQDGDKAAFVRLFEHFAPRVKSYLLKGGTSETLADELAQETMLSVWNKAANFDPSKAAASTWIYTIARNKKIDALRKGVRYDLDINDMEMADTSASPTEKLIQENETDIIADALQKLPAEQADLIRQSFFEGKSHSEIAAEKKLPLGTVKSRLRLALERLRKEKEVKALW